MWRLPSTMAVTASWRAGSRVSFLRADGDEDESGIAESAYLTKTDWWMSAVCGGLVFLFTVGVAFVGIYRNLREEPLTLLAEE